MGNGPNTKERFYIVAKNMFPLIQYSNKRKKTCLKLKKINNQIREDIVMTKYYQI